MRSFLLDSSICLFLLAIGFGAFLQVSENDFVYYDDPGYVIDQSHVQSGLSWENFVWAFNSGECANWHPLTWLSHQADAQFLGGQNAGRQHVMSLAIHALAAVILYLAMKRLTGAVWPSAIVASLFAVHPLGVESVAWISERKNVLSALFWAATLLAYGYYAGRPRVWRYLLVAAAFSLALLSKPTTVTLPFVLLLLDFWPLGRFKNALAEGANKTASVDTAAAELADDSAAVELGSAKATVGNEAVNSEETVSPSAIDTKVAPLHAQAHAHKSTDPQLASPQPASMALSDDAAGADRPTDHAASSQLATDEDNRPETTNGLASDSPPSPADFRWGPLLKRSSVLVLEKLPLFALTAIVSAVTIIVQNTAGALPSLAGLPLDFRISNAIITHVMYVKIMLWPEGLCVFYPHRGADVSTMLLYGSGALLVAVTVVVLLLIRRCPYLAVGWAWYVGVMFPMNGIIQAGSHSMVDRHTYLPIIGLFIALTWAIADLTRKLPGRTLILSASAGAVISALAVCTWYQTRHWKDTRALWQRAVDVTVDNGLALGALGSVLVSENELDDGVRYLKQALRLNPGDVGCNYQMGNAARSRGNLDEAIEWFELALKYGGDSEETEGVHSAMGNLMLERGRTAAAVGHFSALAGRRDDAALVHYDLARALTDLGRIDEAIEHYQEAIKVAEEIDDYREFAEAHNNLGRAYWKYKRDLTLAEKHCRKAIELRPEYADAHNNLGVVLIQLKQFDEAVEHLLTALEELTEQQKQLDTLDQPDSEDSLNQVVSQIAEVHNNLGLVYARQGRHLDAIGEYELAKSFDAQHAPYFYNHGLALERLGRTAEAITQFDEALRIEPGWPLAARRAAWILATNEIDKFRDGDYAVVLASGVCKATAFRDPIGLDTLAAAYAEQGRFEEAVSTAQKALSLAASANLSDLLPEIRERLDLYQNQQPYRAKPLVGKN